MAKSSSPDKVKTELKKLVALAKKEPKFGLALGKTAEDNPVIEASRLKAATTLEKKAQKAAGSKKSTHGKLVLASSKLFFQCEVDPPQGTLRRLKKYFMDHGVSTKVALVLPSGVIEDDDKGAADTAAADTDKRARVVKAFQQLAARLQVRARTEPELDAPINEGITTMLSLLKSEPFDEPTALKQLGALMELDQTATAAGADEKAADPKQLDKTFSELTEGLQSTAKNVPQIAAEMRDIILRYKAARQASPPELAEMAGQVKAAEALSERAELAEDSGAFTNAIMRSELDWKNKVEAVQGQVTALKNEIERATSDLPGTAKIGGALGRLDQQLNKVAAVMSQSLATDGKSGYPTNTTKSLAGVRKLLASDPVLSRLDDNPFLETTAIASLSETLDQIEISLRV